MDCIIFILYSNTYLSTSASPSLPFLSPLFLRSPSLTPSLPSCLLPSSFLPDLSTLPLNCFSRPHLVLGQWPALHLHGNTVSWSPPLASFLQQAHLTVPGGGHSMWEEEMCWSAIFWASPRGSVQHCHYTSSWWHIVSEKVYSAPVQYWTTCPWQFVWHS